MDKEKFIKFTNNPNYISGIYNYCDRWCERCPFTARCLNYKLSEEEFGDPEANDITNERFWKQIEEILKLTFELLDDLMDELDIDIKDIENELLIEEEIDKRVEENICVINANKYIALADKWFESSQEEFEKKERQLELENNLDLPESSPFDDMLTITDAVEVIRWYQIQIYIKLKRAVHGKYIDILFEESDSPKDSDGSAKVALIGIDRSIAAWGKLHHHLPEQEDNILDILVYLTRLRTQVEQEFPFARNFKRVGFDD